MSQREILPTKINLIRLRRAKKSIERIRNILDEKREVLLLYLRQVASEYDSERRKVESKLTSAYRKIVEAMMRMGVENLERIAMLTPESTTVAITGKNVFSVIVPSISLVENTVPRPLYSFSDTSPILDVVMKEMIDVMKDVFKLAEMEASITLLVNELKKTQRLINALNNVILPRYEKQIRFIQQVLEENMREEFVRLKMLKRYFEKRRVKVR